jgi:hypothetical protein
MLRRYDGLLFSCVHNELRARLHKLLLAVHELLFRRVFELLLRRLFKLLRTGVQHVLWRRLVSRLLGRPNPHTALGLAINVCSELSVDVLRFVSGHVRRFVQPDLLRGLCHQLRRAGLPNVLELLGLFRTLQLVLDVHSLVRTVQHLQHVFGFLCSRVVPNVFELFNWNGNPNLVSAAATVQLQHRASAAGIATAV